MNHKWGKAPEKRNKKRGGGEEAGRSKQEAETERNIQNNGGKKRNKCEQGA